jgi:hypothetical protein
MSREAFEAWLNPGHHAGNVSPWVEPGRYQKETHQLAWLAWKAAQSDAYERAAKLCRKIADDPEYGDLFADGAAECAEAIRALAKESNS